MKLYEIDPAIELIMEKAIDLETGEINEDAYEELEKLQIEKEHKAEYIGLCIKNDLADAAEIKAQEDILKQEIINLSKRRNTITNRANRSKMYLAYALKREKLTTPRIAISFRETSSVDVEPDAWRFLPDKYLRHKDPEPDKTEIGKALKEGQTLPGCKLIKNISTIIK